MVNTSHKFTLRALAWLGLMVAPALAADQPPLTYGYELVRSYPHDPAAFTQGLVYENGKLYESTGLYGTSTLRVVDLQTGAVEKMNRLHPRLFAEGLTVFGDRLIQLTWKSRLGLVFDKHSLKLLRTFEYPTEGWGLTHDGHQLIMSDGSATLTFLDPDDFRQVRQIQVTDRGQPLTQLNELEFIQGEIYANVWKSTRIARISPKTGRVTAWIDLSGLNPPRPAQTREDEQRYVLNGIAYDNEQDRVFVTGKRWSNIYQIRVIRANIVAELTQTTFDSQK